LGFVKSARQLVSSGIELLPDYTELARSIYINLVTALYRYTELLSDGNINSSANYDEAEETCEIVLTKDFCDRNLEMQIVMHQCRILIYKSENVECLARGLKALTELGGIILPSSFDDPEAIALYEVDLWKEVLDACQERGFVKSFTSLPVLQDDFLLAVQSLLVELTAPLAWAAPQLLYTIPMVGISLALKHGNCVQAAFHV
jgi:hypothetical protein